LFLSKQSHSLLCFSILSLIQQHPITHSYNFSFPRMHFSLLVASLVVGQVTATGWRLDAQKYPSPYNTKNECSTNQKAGYTWDNLEPGSFSSYGTNKFSGFKCGNSFGKRDGVTNRSFQDKCITADIDKEPKIECDGKDKMTIDSYQVSASWDTDIDAHHEMPDGSICKQTHRCTQGGNTVHNTQCAGSTKVTFKPKSGESGKNEKGESCSIGIHSIGFNCEDHQSSTQPAYSASTTPPTYTSSASEYTYETETTASVASSYETSSEVETISSYGSSATEVPTTSSIEASPETTTSVATVPAFSSYANVSSTAPVESSAGIPSSYAATESSIIGTAPAYESSTIVNSSIATTSTEVSPISTAPVYGTTSTFPANNSAPAYSATTSSDAEVPSQTYEAPDTPDLLPQCVNTWIGQTKCKNNADSTCYCKDAEFVKQVMGCIEAWSDDDSKTQGASSYFQGICAPYVPENPAIITACPPKPTVTPVTETSSSETPEETAPAYSTSSTEGSPITSGVPEQPETTALTYETSSTEGSPVTTSPVEMTTSTVYTTAVSTIISCAVGIENCPAASQSTAIVTQTVAVSTTVCPVSEAETPTSSVEGSPVTTSSDTPVESAPATTAPVEPTTLTYYSTSSITITSCGAEVTDCPAGSTVISEIPVSYTVISTPPASSPASPEQVTSTTPSSEVAVTTLPTGPSTIISYCSTIQIPATYSTGESYGQEIPGSSSYATIDTTITVPQVQFVTSTITAPGSTGTISIGLAAGSPPAAPAYPTPTADAVGGSAASSGFGTSYVPSSTGSQITPYEGGAASVRGSVFAGVVVGGVVALIVV
jgi:hypothetical protein